MNLSKLSAKCKVCPHKDECNHKKMEAVGCLPLPDKPMLSFATEPVLAEVAAPVLRETKDIYVDGHLITVYKDEIEKALYKSLRIGLNYGA